MLNFNDLTQMSAALRATIDRSNFDEATGIVTAHSYRSIISQQREPAIAARMMSRPRYFNQCSIDSDGNIDTGKPKKYSGQDIAQIIIESSRRSADPICYPLSGGNWSKNTIIRLLYLLVNGNAVARFEVDSIKSRTQLTCAELQGYTDPTPILHCTFKSVAFIKNVTTENLPQDFLGNYSGLPIKDSALKGSAPLIFVL